MNLSIRTLFIDDSDSVIKVPMTRYSALLDGELALKEFAGKRLRTVEGVIKLSDRRPVGVLRVSYGYLSFDAKGRVRTDEIMQGMVRSLEAHREGHQKIPGKVVDARYRFSAQKDRWEPTPKLLKRILDGLVGVGKAQRT